MSFSFKKNLESDRLENDKLEPIAVVGMSLKFPQSATSPESFWQMLLHGRSAMTEFPKDRFNVDAYYHPDGNRYGSFPVRGGHFLEQNLAFFDAPFFATTPAEAACMDPQQRLLLETSYTALENAGIPIERCLGSTTSVYTGSFSNDYRNLLNSDPELEVTYAATGIAASILANRVSWFFDFKGPSVNLDSACSSSLMALDVACKGLRNREASMSLVGGSNLIIHPEFMFAMSNLNFLSPDSRSYSFDHRANGYARGEGIGVIVIKLLSDAVRDGDTIRAVIRSTGSNQDGRTPGITVPNGTAQEDLIRQTYRAGGLDMGITRFFEAHGTGTAVGDPVEAKALGRSFQQHRTVEDPLYVGAVKANVGHLEGASGVAGLIKAVLVLENGLIPPNINFEKTNPRIDPEALRIHFPTRVTPWPSQGLRRASVNSFGFGGSNTHVVLDDAYNYLALRKIKANHITVPLPPAREYLLGEHTQESLGKNDCDGISTPQESKLLIWSAADEAGLKRVATDFECYAKQSKQMYTRNLLEDLAYTLGAKRSRLDWKSYLVTNDISDLKELQVRLSKPLKAVKARNLAFIFTGQGAQYPRMGQELLTYEVFRNSLQAADSFFLELGSNWSLMNILLKSGESTTINSPEYSQPLCTALQIALLELLEKCNIRPVTVLGHSSGEIAAAYCCGALSRESAWRVAFYRGKVAASLAQQKDGHGAMISVGLPEEAIDPYLSRLAQHYGSENVVVGCINSPANVTLTGNATQIEQMESWLNNDNVFVRRLHVNVAYHSPSMNTVVDAYLADLKDLKAGKPTNVTMISSVTGVKIQTQELCCGEYWTQNMVLPVQFLKALTHICLPPVRKQKKRLGKPVPNAVAVNDLLEIGPHSALRGPIRDSLTSLGRVQDVAYHTSLTRNSSAARVFQETLGRLHCSGYPVDLLQANNLGFESRPALVDLPEYPFNHSQFHWIESRFSKDTRFRKHARSDLLGVPSFDWNPLEPRWRYMIRSDDIPWVEDHKINGVCIYPAAGMISMAVEAMKQTSENKEPFRPISGYRIENAKFLKALRIPLDQPHIEVSLSLRPVADALESGRTWYEYRLCAYEDESWEECCHGRIQAEYKQQKNQVDSGRASSREIQHYQKLFNDAFTACDLPLATEKLYRLLDDDGALYGPSFQVLSNVWYSSGECQSIAEISLSLENLEKDKILKRPYVFHPATLDGMFQMIFPALGRGGQRKLPTMVPSRIQSLYISAQGLSESEGPQLRAFAQCEFKGYREAESSMCAISSETANPCIVLQSLHSTFLTNDDSKHDARDIRRLCASMDWKPDLDVSSGGDIQEYCERSRPQKESPAKFYEDLRLMIFYFIVNAVGKMEQFAGPQEYHRAKYQEWMKEQVRRHEHGELSISQSELNRVLTEPAYRDALIQRVQCVRNEGRFFAAVGESLLNMMQGKVDALDLLFKGDLAQNYYQELNGDPHLFEPFASYLECFTHKHAFIKILEIGAGTGGATLPVLEALSAQCARLGSTQNFHYDFTDISPGFFTNAQERFARYGEAINFKVLDIEKDPCLQGFQEEEYDLIVASNVLHATRDIYLTLSNVRRLLKPEAKLALFEVTEPHMMRTGFAFGLLRGWWLATNDERRWSPCLTEPAWNNALCQTGFSGIDVLLPDHHEAQFHESSIMITTASNDGQDNPLTKMSIAIITADNNTAQQILGRQLLKQLKSTQESPCELLSLEKAAASTGNNFAIYVCLIEVDDVFLSKIQEDEFASLKRIISSSKCIVWVSRDAGHYLKHPEFDMISGFARSVRSEYSQLKFVTVTIAESCPMKSAETILTILRRTTIFSTAQIEPEYRQRNKMLEISRVVGNDSLNHTLAIEDAGEKRTIREFGNGIPLVLHVAAPGFLESLEFHEDHEVDERLGENEVEVEVKVTGVNFRDCLIALGSLPEKSLGTECAGVVQRVGSKVTSLSRGDRVSVVSTNAYKTFMRANASCAIQIPNGMSFIDAASFPTTALTVYHALLSVARLQKDETILIHSGAGGTGQMAIQIAQHVQAKIYTTVGSMDKQRLLIDLYGIPAQHIFNSRDTSFAQGIRQETQGRGVDVVLNSLSGEGLKASWESIAPFGRFIEIGKADIQSHRSLQMSQFARNVSFSAVDLVGIIQERPLLLQQLFQGMMALVTDGKLRPAQPMTVFPVSEIAQAFQHLQSGKNMGKAVVEYHQDDLVTTVLKNRTTYDFNNEVSYLIAGGLGGLGRSIARWMVNRGARHLILVSRSGPKSSAAKDLLADLRQGGVKVETPACDIGCADAVCHMLEECAKTMPPIKGCIQGTMILRDTVFENMSYEDFIVSTNPKVAGSWNLHTFLPKNMDFFILLSSICGVFGAAGQANYCAGNSYEDALAQFRIANGEKAVSLDLGMMIAEGVVAENEGLMGFLKRTGYFMEIAQPEFFTLLDRYCNPSLPILTPLDCQIIVGIEIPEVLNAAGLEQPEWMRRPMFRHFHQMVSGDAASLDEYSKAPSYASLLRNADSNDSAVSVVSAAITDKIGRVMGIEAKQIDLSKPMYSYGVDSLVAVEVRSWLLRELGADVATFDILGSATLFELSGTIVSRSSHRK